MLRELVVLTSIVDLVPFISSDAYNSFSASYVALWSLRTVIEEVCRHLRVISLMKLLWQPTLNCSPTTRQTPGHYTESVLLFLCVLVIVVGCVVVQRGRISKREQSLRVLSLGDPVSGMVHGLLTSVHVDGVEVE